MGLVDNDQNTQQGVYSNVPREQAKHNGLNVGNLDNDYTNDEDDKDVGKGSVLADEGGTYKSPYETEEGIKKLEEGANKQGSDTNKGTENDKLTDEAKANTSEKYKEIVETIRKYRDLANSEEEKMNLSDEDKKKLKKAYKRNMLMSGIADAANSFHKAFSYGAGIKAMNDKDFTEETKKKIREDEEWYNKNRDRIMNYHAKAADLEKTYAALLNQDRLRDQQEAAQQYRYDRLKLDIQKAADTKSLNEKKLEIQEMLALGRISKMQHDMLMDELDKQIKQQNANTASARESRMGQGSTTTTTKVDVTGIPTTTTQVKQVGTGGTSSNSNAGTSNTGKKPLPQENSGKKPLPQS